MLALLCSCGASHAKAETPAALKLQREDLALVSRALQRARAPVARAVSATKGAWPLIVNGLPRELAALSSSPQIARALASSAQLPTPSPFGEEESRALTGPASQIAGLYRAYAQLSARGWRMLDSSISQIRFGTPLGARFARENVALYIESIYDANFSLAQIAKKLTLAYEKLGGAGEFGSALPEAEVDALAETYSEASDRLHPHVGVRLGS